MSDLLERKPCKPTSLWAEMLDPKYYFWLLGMVALLGALILYALMPAMGVESVSHSLSLGTIWGLTGLFLGGVFYWYYLDKVREKPQYLLLGFFLFFPVFNFLMEMATSKGLNVRVGFLVLLLYTLPVLLMSFKSFLFLWRETPHFKYYFIFVLLVLAFYFFNNANAVEYRSLAKDGGSYRLLSEAKTYGAFLLLTSCLVVGSVFRLNLDFEQLFYRFNKILLFLLTSYALLAMVAYPLHLMTLSLEGYTRMQLIFTHPNSFGYYMGFMLLYLMGLFFYTKNPTLSYRLSQKHIVSAMIVSFFGLMLSLSKGAIAGFAVCALFLFLANLVLQGLKLSSLLKYTLYTVLVLGICLAGLKLSGLSEVIENRLANNSSLEWRLDTWGRLLSYCDFSTLFSGHGLTAANAKIFQLTYSANRAGEGFIPSTKVHNILLETFYDFGVLGLSWLLGLVMLFRKLFSNLRQEALNSPNKPLYLLIMALTLFYGVCIMIDEMFYAPFYPYWYFMTFLFCFTRRSQPALNVIQRSQNKPISEGVK